MVPRRVLPWAAAVVAVATAACLLTPASATAPLMMVSPSSSAWQRPGHARLATAAVLETHDRRRRAAEQQHRAAPLQRIARRKARASSSSSLLLQARGGGGSGGGAGGWATVIEGLKNGCASGLAAACAKLLLQPFDTLKTIQQANKGSLGMVAAAHDLVARKGVSALYTGLGVTLVGSIPAVSIYFGVYQAAKRAALQALPPGLGWTLLGVAASAAFGNTVASVFRVPYEVVKQRLQAGMYATTREALRTMYRDEGGVLAFFGQSGVASQIMRDVPYAIVTLLTYESLRRARAELRKDGSTSTPFEDSMIGAFAGGVGSLISNPMDVVKTRVMTQPALYPGVRATVAKLWAEEGAAAFFKGTAPRLLHKVPANAIFFATYEIFRGLLRVQG